MNRARSLTLAAVALLAMAGFASAQPPSAIEPVSFDEAVRRATTANPSVAIAAANILRAEAFLKQARAAIRPAISAEGLNVTLDNARESDGAVVTPQNSFTASIPVSMPLYAPACDIVKECRTVTQLVQVVDQLVHQWWRRGR